MFHQLFFATATIYTVWAGSKYFSIRNKQATISAITYKANIIANAGAEFLTNNAGHPLMNLAHPSGVSISELVNSIKLEYFSEFIKKTVSESQAPGTIVFKIDEHFNKVALVIERLGRSYTGYPKQGYGDLIEALNTNRAYMDWSALKGIKDFSDINEDPNAYSYKAMASATVAAIAGLGMATGYTIDSLLASACASSGTEMSDLEELSGFASNSTELPGLEELLGLDNAGKAEI